MQVWVLGASLVEMQELRDELLLADLRGESCQLCTARLQVLKSRLQDTDRLQDLTCLLNDVVNPVSARCPCSVRHQRLRRGRLRVRV
ncbi:MAG: hypothetical protein ACXVP5_12805 [Tumebacillaceae bacterium]